MPACSGVLQARRRWPSAVSIQQSWQAPMAQKPARGASLISLWRKARALRQHGGQHGVAVEAGAGPAVELEGHGLARPAGQPQSAGATFISAPPAPCPARTGGPARTITAAVRPTISADTAAIIGSIDSVASMYMRTGSVTVCGW
jgi:hypothetical protein